MILLCFTTGVFAASDIETNWAKKYITHLNDKNIMFPSGENFKPNAEVGRAEFMRYINRTFQFTEKTDVSKYTDLAEGSWYYEDVAIAVKHGYINGTSETTMNPLGKVTRQEVITILGRLHKNAPEGETSFTFKDKRSIGSWAAGYVNEAVEKGYVVGYPDNTFRPTNVITRSEVSKIIYYFMGNRLDQTQEYNSSALVIDAKNVTISNGIDFYSTEVKGDLYITEGTLDKNVLLEDIKVDGKLVISGGNVTLNNVTASEIIVDSPTGRTLSVTATGKTNIPKTIVKTDSELSETGLDVSAGGFSEVVLDGKNNISLALDASVWDLKVKSAANISLEQVATYIYQVTFNAQANVSGFGEIENAVIKSENVNIGVVPRKYTIENGVTAIIDGKTVSTNTYITATPSMVTFDTYYASATNQNTDIDITLSIDSSDVSTIVCRDKTLMPGTEYRRIGNKIKMLKSYLSTLPEGTHILEITSKDNKKVNVSIKVIDTSKNVVSIPEAKFDKYRESTNYKDVSITVTPAIGNTLRRITAAGFELKIGEDYTYNENKVVVLRSYLEKKSVGNLTVNFEFSNGNAASTSLIIEDSSPVNSLDKTEVSFDLNPNSSLYEDITIKLTTVEGATLEDIRYGVSRELLTPVADYYILDDNKTVIIRKRAVAKMATTKEIDLTFVMSKGERPVLRINVKNTYNAVFYVKDNQGNPVRSAKIVIDDDAKTTLTTDANGYASVSLEVGSYTATISADAAETKSQSFVVSTTGTVINANIKTYNIVSFFVTQENGAMISGATVQFGNKNVTTGVDGIASFEVEPGSYTVSVTKPGYTSVTETVAVSTKTTKRIVLQQN